VKENDDVQTYAWLRPIEGCLFDASRNVIVRFTQPNSLGGDLCPVSSFRSPQLRTANPHFSHPAINCSTREDFARIFGYKDIRKVFADFTKARFFLLVLAFISSSSKVR
jgi:hypothetical protein